MSQHAPSAAILAGGQATRFGGRDKSALPVDGRTILEHQIAALAPLTDDLMIVGTGTHDVQPRHGLPTFRVVPDIVPGCERGYHPLCAVYMRACLAPAAARLDERRLKMVDLVDSMRTRVVRVQEIRRFGDPNRLLANVNTQGDYADLEALQGHKL